MDHLEAAVSAAEKDLEPSKIRKVFSSLPGLGVSTCVHVVSSLRMQNFLKE